VRVVLDTNVLGSAVLFGGLPRKILLRALRGEFDVVTTVRLMAEFENVLAESFDVQPQIARAARSEYELLADVVRPRQIPQVARDPDDNEVLAAARSGDAELVVTGDHDLLALAEYDGTRIITPRQFEENVDPDSG
jgi:putative PIN family toxin of toxin-antitoxin system